MRKDDQCRGEMSKRNQRHDRNRQRKADARQRIGNVVDRSVHRRSRLVRAIVHSLLDEAQLLQRAAIKSYPSAATISHGHHAIPRDTSCRILKSRNINDAVDVGGLTTGSANPDPFLLRQWRIEQDLSRSDPTRLSRPIKRNLLLDRHQPVVALLSNFSRGPDWATSPPACPLRPSR